MKRLREAAAAATPSSSKNVQKWLAGRLAYSLHKPRRKRFPTRKYRTSGINDVWQMDLMEMIPFAKINKGYKYILTCIDIFTRFVRAVPLKTKTGAEVSVALKLLFKKQKPIKIQTDLGKEFYNSHVKDVLKSHKIGHYTVYSQFKAAIVERFNRTLREKLNRWFTHSGKKVWHTVLDDIISTYNKTPHGGIFKMRPIEITKDNEHKVWTLKNKPSNTLSKKMSGPKLLDHVRISQIKGDVFVRNFDQNWSDEVFNVVGIDTKTHPTMYTISDHDNEVLEGRFYAPELQVIPETPKVYRIEKIIRSRGKGANKQYFVKWVGYTSKHNSWISKDQIEKM